MKQHIPILILFLLLTPFNLRAEDSLRPFKNIFFKNSPVKNKFTFKLSNTLNTGEMETWNMQTGHVSYGIQNLFQHRLANFRVEANYGLLSCLEVGLYFGFTNMGAILGHPNYPIIRRYLLHLGGQVNFHPIGLIVDQDRSRFDFWLSYKYGRNKRYQNTKQSVMKPYLLPPPSEYGFGLGFGFYPFKTKNLGFYLEYSVGQWPLKYTNIYKALAEIDHEVRWGAFYKINQSR